MEFRVSGAYAFTRLSLRFVGLLFEQRNARDDEVPEQWPFLSRQTFTWRGLRLERIDSMLRRVSLNLQRMVSMS